jgi:hypothetical protein
MARKKLRWQAFVELNQAVLADLHPAPDWHGLRVVACDGTTLYLPTTHPDTIDGVRVCGGQIKRGAIAGNHTQAMPIWCGMEVCQNRLVKFNKGLPTQLLARHAESVVMSATAQGQGNPGEELIKLDLQRAHQIDEQDANDALEGENGAAGKVASSLSMSGNKVHGRDEGVNFID